jgi:hypothetical protein
MRCSHCGFESAANVAFCSRCGTRIMMPRPETRHEYALTRILPSWWHFMGSLILIAILTVGGVLSLAIPHGGPVLSVLLLALASFLLLMVSLISR